MAKYGNMSACLPSQPTDSDACLCANQMHHIHTYLFRPFSYAHTHKYMPRYTQRHRESIEPSHGLMFGRVGLDLLLP